MPTKTAKKVTKKRRAGRRANSYSCPFCLYTGEEQKPAQAHYDRHVAKIAKHAGFELVKIGEVEKIAPVVTQTLPVNTNIMRAV